MKMRIVLTAILTLVLAAAISAQDRTAANFAGTWTLDAGKSKMDERARGSIESMTWTVTQTEKELKIETKTKRAARPEGEMSGGGGGQGRGMGRGGFGAGGDGTTVYSLDGKETKAEQETAMGKIPVSYKANLEKGGKLTLNSSRTFSTQMGEMTVTTKETWTLSEDGKILTVKREIQTPRGAQTSEMVFTKS